MRRPAFDSVLKSWWFGSFDIGDAHVDNDDVDDEQFDEYTDDDDVREFRVDGAHVAER